MLTIKDSDKKVIIKHLVPQKPRKLVGIDVILAHNPEALKPSYKEKISQYCAQLVMCLLSASKILVGYNSFW